MIHRNQSSQPSRRRFLQGAAAALAAPMIVPSRVLGADAPSNRMQLAAIGTGRMGQGDMKEAIFQGMDINARMVAVCDLDKLRVQHAAEQVKAIYAKQKPNESIEVKTYTDFRELLQRKDIDGLTISTPDHQHAIIAVAAANAGKGMYIQKPLTYSVVEGQKLVEAVRKNQVILQTGSQQRTQTYFRRVVQLVLNGKIGKLQAIEVGIPTDSGRGNPAPMPVPENLNYDMWLGPTPEAPYAEDRVHPQKGYGRPGWLQIEAYCRGMITGWGAHMYDVAQWGMGLDTDSGPVRVKATADFPDRGLFNVHTNYSAEAYYANGVKLISRNGAAGVKFIGDAGWAYCSREKFDAHDKALLRQDPSEKIQLKVNRSHMQDFLLSLRAKQDPICPVEVGHRSNTVCVIHHIAMKLGRELQWDPKAEKFINDDAANQLLDFPHREPWKV